jgi:chromosome segregation ATPase
MEPFLIEKVEHLSNMVTKLIDQVEEHDAEIIRMAEQLENQSHILQKLGVLKDKWEEQFSTLEEAIEEHKRENPNDRLYEIAKAIEELQDIFRNNGIITIQDKIVKDVIFNSGIGAV